MASDQYDVMDPSMPSNDPTRVWSKEGKWPGAAFSRSIGDFVAKKLGVIAEPDFQHMHLTSDETIFVLGSDGIFDFITNDEVAEIADANSDPADACRALVGVAYHRWSLNEERTDVISVIVGRIVRGRKRSVLQKIKEKVKSTARRLLNSERQVDGLVSLPIMLKLQDRASTALATNASDSLGIITRKELHCHFLYL